MSPRHAAIRTILNKRPTVIELWRELKAEHMPDAVLDAIDKLIREGVILQEVDTKRLRIVGFSD